MFSIPHLHRLRDAELERVLRELPPAPRHVLELGSGTGYQAKVLTGRGYRVTAIDLPSSEYIGERVFPVIDYDGMHLPVPDRSVDVVFSSNVLEHVRALDTIMAEIARVLTPGGCAIHIMPSPSWRFWTLVSGWLDLVPFGFDRLRRLGAGLRSRRLGDWALDSARGAAGRILPLRHGETGNALTELWSFGAGWWRRQFLRNGFEVLRVEPMGLFYTGFMLLGPRLPLAVRARLARTLGSACILYIVRPRGAS